MRWLYENKSKISSDEYIKFLENLSDRYYLGHYAGEKDFFELITQNNFDLQLTRESEKRLESLLNSGTSIPNFIFNRLDYLLWKKQLGNYKNFRFSFRSSVEHFYPQNPQNGKQLSDKVLHCLGNLCLISSGMNSKFSNNMPEAKVANFGKEQNLSLKLSLMMEQAKNWNQETIKEQHKKMKNLLAEHSYG